MLVKLSITNYIQILGLSLSSNLLYLTPTLGADRYADRDTEAKPVPQTYSSLYALQHAGKRTSLTNHTPPIRSSKSTNLVLKLIPTEPASTTSATHRSVRPTRPKTGPAQRLKRYYRPPLPIDDAETRELAFRAAVIHSLKLNPTDVLTPAASDTLDSLLEAIRSRSSSDDFTKPELQARKFLQAAEELKQSYENLKAKNKTDRIKALWLQKNLETRLTISQTQLADTKRALARKSAALATAAAKEHATLQYQARISAALSESTLRHQAVITKIREIAHSAALAGKNSEEIPAIMAHFDLEENTTATTQLDAIIADIQRIDRANRRAIRYAVGAGSTAVATGLGTLTYALNGCTIV